MGKQWCEIPIPDLTMADPKADGMVCENSIDVNHIHFCFAQSVSDIEEKQDGECRKKRP